MTRKFALVTGGSRGIGKAVCFKLAEMGIPVLIGYNSKLAAAQEVCEKIRREGGDASIIKFDVADKEEVEMPP